MRKTCTTISTSMQHTYHHTRHDLLRCLCNVHAAVMATALQAAHALYDAVGLQREAMALALTRRRSTCRRAATAVPRRRRRRRKKKKRRFDDSVGPCMCLLSWRRYDGVREDGAVATDQVAALHHLLKTADDRQMGVFRSGTFLPPSRFQVRSSFLPLAHGDGHCVESRCRCCCERAVGRSCSQQSVRGSSWRRSWRCRRIDPPDAGRMVQRAPNHRYPEEKCDHITSWRKKDGRRDEDNIALQEWIAVT